MPRSMTGFGVARASDGPRTYVVEVRSVNHRYCDVRTHLPGDLGALGPEIEARVRKAIRRGRVDVSVAVEVAEGATVEPSVDLARARGYKAAYEKLAKELGLEPRIELAQIASAPGVIRGDQQGAGSDPRESVLSAVDDGLRELGRMRETEGATLCAQLSAHLATVAGLVDLVREQLPGVAAERKRRLEDRLTALLEDNKLDPARLAQEVAILADRADVTEELERLDSHVDQFRALLESSDAVGRRLDFLIQEMNREVNTIGSKSSDAQLAYVVVDLKTELERLREQIQNLE